MAHFEFDGWWDHIFVHSLNLSPGSEPEKAAKVIGRAVWNAAQTAARQKWDDENRGAEQRATIDFNLAAGRSEPE